jgi:anti-sigma B factor antagonist
MRVTTVCVTDDVYVCSVAGDVGATTSDPLRLELLALTESTGRRVVADLIDVTFLDFHALEILLAAAQRLRTDGGELVVVCDDPRMARMFEVCGATREFRVESSLADVVADLAESPVPLTEGAA